MHRVYLASIIVAFAAPTAFAQHFTSVDHAATHDNVGIEDPDLAIEIVSRDVDQAGAIGDPTTTLYTTQVRCAARQLDALVQATADAATLDALIALAVGHLRITVLDITELGFDPIEHDHRYDYGVEATAERIEIVALQNRGGCTITPAARLHDTLRALGTAKREPTDIAATGRALLARVHARKR